MFQNFADIDQYLQTAFARGCQATESRQIVQQLGTATTLLHALGTLMTNEEQIRRVASMSYRHRNGFDMFVLWKSVQPEYKLRLHIWWPEYSHAKQQMEAIHNHSWDFSSTILTGAFVFQVYAFSQNENDVKVYHYRARNDSSLRFVFMEQTMLTCVYDAIMLAGCSYSFDHTVLHRIINMPNTTTSTLVLQGRSQQDYSDIFVEQPFEGENGHMPKFTTDECIAKLQCYMALLERP
jgi:hypothetical protein